MQPDQTLAARLSGYYKPYAVIDVGPEKVAVVGYTTAETPFLSMPGKHPDVFYTTPPRCAGAFLL